MRAPFLLQSRYYRISLDFMSLLHLRLLVPPYISYSLIAGLFVSTLPMTAGPKNTAKPSDMSLTDLNGARVRLRDYRGSIVVLNFWATWCRPCNEEMPMLVAAEKEYRDRGVVFIAISLDEPATVGSIPRFLSKYGVRFPVWTGATGDDLARLRLGEAVPATAFVDRDGVITGRVSGQLRNDELTERLEWLLGDRSAPAPAAFVDHVSK
jgi:thiol-disulfide isomerase/thioredoxin